MRVYLSSPGNQMQAAAVKDMPVLLSFAVCGTWDWIGSYAPSFSRVLVDSGAFSEFNSGKVVDLDAYAEWAKQWHWADAIAALDDIRGDWKKGIANWRKYPHMFPTYHSSDPPEALEAILKFRPKWLGLGMVPPRNKEPWLRRTLNRLENVPVHVHGFALQEYAHLPRLDSVDSTNWFRDSQKLLVNSLTRHLTPAEALEIVVKRYQRRVRLREQPSQQEALAL